MKTNTDTQENRKRTKPLTERKRRARINNALLQLKSIVLQAVHPELVLMSKLEKADLLEMANAYILHLQSSTVVPGPHTVSTYSLGFNECAAEVMRFIDTCDEHQNRDCGETNTDRPTQERNSGLHSRILEHLTGFASSKEVVERCATERGWVKSSPNETIKISGGPSDVNIEHLTESHVQMDTLTQMKTSLNHGTTQDTPSIHVSAIPTPEEDRTPLPPIQSFLLSTCEALSDIKTITSKNGDPSKENGDPSEVSPKRSTNNSDESFPEPEVPPATHERLNSSTTFPTDGHKDDSEMPMSKEVTIPDTKNATPATCTSSTRIKPGTSKSCKPLAGQTENAIGSKEDTLPLSNQPIRKRLSARFGSKHQSLKSRLLQATRNTGNISKQSAKCSTLSDNDKENVEAAFECTVGKFDKSNIDEMVDRTTQILSRSMRRTQENYTGNVTHDKTLSSNHQRSSSGFDDVPRLSNYNHLGYNGRQSSMDASEQNNEGSNQMFDIRYSQLTGNGPYLDSMWRPW